MTRRAVLFVVGLTLIAALPLAMKGLRHDAAERCALNGIELDPLHAVRVVDEASGESRRFCCTGCVEAWLLKSRQVARRIFVVDEETGREIDAKDAWFVRSSVVAVPATDNHVHAFASEAAARRHADEFRGTLLEGDERPFHWSK